MSHASRKPARWHIQLSGFVYQVVHGTGIEHLTVATLTWLPTKFVDDILLDIEVPVFAMSKELYEVKEGSESEKEYVYSITL